MLETASEITLCLLIAAFIGFLIGYLTCKMNNVEDSKKEKENITKTIEDIPTVKEKSNDNTLISTKKDDLTIIKGIGPKAKATLNALGIQSFTQIASWDDETYLWLEENTTFVQRAKKDNWKAQAKKLL